MIGMPVVYFGLYGLQMMAVLAIVSVDLDAGLGPVQLLWWGVIFAVGLRCGWVQDKAGNKQYEALGNAVALFGMLVFFLLLLWVGLEQALLSLLLWAQAAQNFTLVKHRLYFTLGVSFCLLLYAAANSKSGLFLLLLAAYVLVAMFTLYCHYLDQRYARVTVPVETLGKLPWLAPVLSLSSLVLLLAFIAYLVIPRPPALHFGTVSVGGGTQYRNSQWEEEAQQGNAGDETSAADDRSGAEGMANDANGDKQQQDVAPKGREKRSSGTAEHEGSGNGFSYNGFKADFDIAEPGKGRLSNAIVLYVQADRALYLKGKVFDYFDGHSWSRMQEGSRKRRLKDGVVEFERLSAAGTDTVFQSVTLAMDSMDTVFAAEHLQQITFPAAVIAQDRYGGIQAPARLKQGTQYSVESRIDYVDQHPASGVVVEKTMDSYLQLPEDISPRIGVLAAEITAATPLPLAKAEAIEHYLRTEYRYTLDTVFNDDLALERFLFETRAGHCELFASAMVMMLRSVGIKARLATGFSATNLNPLTGYYEVRGLDAHAWVEAYFPAQGWVLFEPTAYYALPAPPADKSVSAAFADYVQNLAQSSQVLKPETLETDWLQWWSALFRAIGEFWQQAGQALGNLLNHVWQWLKAGGILLVTGLLALAAGIYFFRAMLETRWSLWRIRRLIRRKPPCDVFAIYASLENYFAVRGHPRNTAWTVAEYGHRLQQEFPSDAEGIGSILAAFSQARYGHAAPDAAIISAAAAHLQGLVNNNN